MQFFFRRLATFCFGVVLYSATTTSAQIFSPLHTFSKAAAFAAPLVQGPDGTFYGVSSSGGLGNLGTVFQIQPDGSHFSILHSFSAGAMTSGHYTNTDGAVPMAGLVVSNNVLYGTTKDGGVTGFGSVFKINTDGSGFAVLHFFTNGAAGSAPRGSLALSAGSLYGSTSAGGSGSDGTLFKVNIDGTGFTNLFTFNGTNGAISYAGLIVSESTLYGTTQGGGTNGGGGIVFKIDTNGTGFTTLHFFTAIVSGTNSDGAHPEASLILSGNTLYGTAMSGGRGYGTVFGVNTDGTSFTNLYNFTNSTTSGSSPVASLVLSGSTLYGTTYAGGPFPGYGSVFGVNTDGTGFTNLFSFASGTSGTMPESGLVFSGGALYGTTLNTSGGGGGTVYKVNTNGLGFTVLANGSDGAQPQGGLVLLGDSFYGTTSAGGTAGEGVVFRVSTNGTSFTTLHTFSLATYDPESGGNFYTNSDGATPVGTLASSGSVLYGTTEIGGAFGGGTVFRVNTDGTSFTNLYNFTNGPGGGQPLAGLVLSGNALYGTASGDFNSGTIFKINTDGTGFTNLYYFTALINTTNSDGDGPLSGLVLGGDTLYGAAFHGGPGGAGTLFKINTNGLGFTAFYNFPVPLRGTNNDPDGANPAGSLILSGNTLYGTTSYGGPKISLDPKEIGGPGTVFRVNTDGTGFVMLHAFTNAFDGSAAKGALALSGSTLYGTASGGGNGNAGTVFQLDTSGTGFTTLHTFPFQQGTPVGDLVVFGNTVYGTSEFGAVASASSLPGAGSVFAETSGFVPSLQFTASPTNGLPPRQVQFTAPATDSGGNPIISWHWDFGDGSTNTTQNPLHTYTTNGTYFPVLTAINNNGATITGFGPVIVVAFPSSIQNNGFEAGTFTNWTGSGNLSGRSVTTSANYVHSGTYGAQLAASGSLGFLSQTITTIPGRMYTISFWLDNPVAHTPNEFLVSWEGNVLMDKTNLPALAWTNIQFTVTATVTNTVLQFGFQYNTAFFGLDDISVTAAAGAAAIASISLSGTNLLVNGSGGESGQTYYLLMGTNATQPLGQWTPMATNVLGVSGNFSFIATNAANPGVLQRFYILQLQ